MDLSEPTLEAVFPSTLLVNGTTFSKDHTDHLESNGNLSFQWGLYTSGSSWIVRICKPDSVTTPAEYLYDQFDSTEADSLTAQEWLMTCIVQNATLWNV